MSSQLDDAFGHHVWATERLIDECSGLSPEQLEAPVPGTYGSIIRTLRHLVASDAWYLTFFRTEGIREIDEEAAVGLAELRSVTGSNGTVWRELLAGGLDPDADVTEIDNGWELHTPVGLRLAQVVHHGTDHRSQICTALSGLGMTPPDIDVWAWGRAVGRERGVELPKN